MNRVVLLLFLFSLIFNPTIKGQNSPLSSGQWVKLAVGKQGIFQLTGNQLKQMGLAIPCTSSQIQLYGFNLANLQETPVANMAVGLVENAIQVNDGGDGKFDELDHFLFYSEGPVRWVFNETDSLFDHFNNATKDSVYFFLTLGANGKRITTAAPPNNYDKIVDQFDERWLIEKDTISLLNSGQLWVGNAMGQGIGKQSKLNYLLNTEGINIDAPIKFKTSFAASSFSGPGNFIVKWNDQVIQTASINPVSGLVYDETAFLKRFNFEWAYKSLIPLPNNANVSIDFVSAAVNSTGWIDFIQMHAKKTIGFFNTGSFGFRNSSVSNNGLAIQYKIQGAAATTIVWDVSRPARPVNMQLTIQAGSIGSFVHVSDTVNEFMAVQQQVFESPVFAGKIANQNLLGAVNVEYIIVTPTAYKNAAIKLQVFHKNESNLNVGILGAEEIYNEFSGGQVSPIGIRNCIKYFVEKAIMQKTTPPKYLLLLGIGNFELKKLNSATQIPTYQSVNSTSLLSSFTSDDFFGLLSEGANMNAYNSAPELALAIGRLPVRNAAEADTLVDKIIQYQQGLNEGAWKNQLTWVADDGDYNLHLQDAEEITQNLQNKSPLWNHKKLYLDLYKATSTTSGNTYPALVTDLNQVINNGSLILNYTGHGNYLRLSEEAVIADAGITQWDNRGKLPLMITASCDFAPYDQPQLSPIGFDALMKNGKGIIGVVAASRLVFAYSNKQLNDLFIQSLLVPDTAGKMSTIGASLMRAKNKYWALVPDRVNAFKFSLLGDPAMKLAAAKYKVKLAAINQKQFIGSDTLTAGAIYKVIGKIEDNGQVKTNFNGLVELVLYDAVKSINTIANLPSSMSVAVAMQENILFRGKANVSNGAFAIEFILPKETVGTNGALKMQLYASNEKEDAIGVYNEIFVNNKLDNSKLDTLGPVINGFINDTNFIDGAWVTTNAKLLINLADSAGIQTSGNALGHDIVLVIDGDYKNPILLNNYYTAAINTYQKGSIIYALPQFSEGKHVLLIKAWDLLGNSNTDTLFFEVPPTQNMMLRKFSISPNPVGANARFSFEHNQLNTPLKLQLEIFDINGSRVFSKQMEDSYSSNLVVINWDASAGNGARLLPGFYYCRILATVNKTTISLPGKFVKY
ncbi:MAG: hypothetical protein RL064_926 [Bacteroidota bacterium]